MRTIIQIENITFALGFHRNQAVIWCQFNKDNLVLAQLKQQFSHCKWSNTAKGWYILDKPELRNQVGLKPKEVLDDLIAKVNESCTLLPLGNIWSAS